MTNGKINAMLDHLGPWLESEYIHSSVSHEDDTLIVRFADGKVEVISVNEPDTGQIRQGIRRLEKMGIRTVSK